MTSRRLVFLGAPGGGHGNMSVTDLRQIVPWVLFDKLKINAQGAFFQKAEHKVYLTDRVAWIRQMFDRAIRQQAAYRPVRQPLLDLQKQLDPAGETLTSGELHRRLRTIRTAIDGLMNRNELNGPVHEDLIRLKDLHTRCLQATQSRPGHFE